jgi:hypothetical protein
MASDIFVDPSVTDPVIKVGGICYYRQDASDQPVNVDEIDDTFDDCYDCEPAPCECAETDTSDRTCTFPAGGATVTPTGGGSPTVVTWTAGSFTLHEGTPDSCSYIAQSAPIQFTIDGVPGFASPDIILGTYTDPEGNTICAWLGQIGLGSPGNFLLWTKSTGSDIDGTYALTPNYSCTYSGVTNGSISVS